MTWVSVKEAAEIMNCAHGTIYHHAQLRGWRTKLVRSGPDVHGRFYLREDVEASPPIKRATQRAYRVATMEEKRRRIRSLVKWANGLKAWPSDEEIDARTCPEYTRTAVVGILDTRVERGLAALREDSDYGRRCGRRIECSTNGILISEKPSR